MGTTALRGNFLALENVLMTVATQSVWLSSAQPVLGERTVKRIRTRSLLSIVSTLWIVALITPLTVLARPPSEDIYYCVPGQITDTPSPNAEAVLASEPRTARDYYDRGMEWCKRGNYEAALADLNESLRIDSSNYLAHNARGLVLYQLGDYDAALAGFDRALELEPDFALGHYNRGTTLNVLQDYAAALEALNLSLNLDPDYPFAWSERGLAYYGLGEYQSALDNYDQAIELDSENTTTFYNRGLTYHNMGRYEEALADFNQAVELNPDYVYSYSSRGLTHQTLGDYEAAIVDYSRAIRLEQLDIWIFFGRAQSYYAIKDYAAAIEDYTHIVETIPDYAGAYFNRALAYMAEGDTERALPDYDVALSLFATQIEELEMSIDAEALRQSITQSGEQVHIAFEGQAGMRISIETEAIDSAMDTILLLRGPDDEPLAFNDVEVPQLTEKKRRSKPPFSLNCVSPKRNS